MFDEIYKSIGVGLCLVMLTNSPASTEDVLYGAPLPDDAAFVRAIGFDGNAMPEAFGSALTADQNYMVLRADEVDGIEAGQYVTFLPETTVAHAPQDDVSKVQIGFFNSGYSGPIDLKTTDGKVTIAQADPNAAGFREVNPIVVPVAVFSGDTMLGDPIELMLRRDENPTILVTSDGTITSFVSRVIWDE